MNEIRAMIVDDSPFSRTIIADSLLETGYEVVGEADGLDTLIEAYDACKPDIVTMDIAMPGADGFECSKHLLRHDPMAKIIMISSMKDEETEAEARRIGVAGYVQKPIDGEVLARVVKSVLSPDALYEALTISSSEVFQEAISQSVTRMTKTTVSFTEMPASDSQFISQGITVITGIIGRYSGSMIIDLSPDAAEKMTEAILRRPAKNRDEIVAMAGEFTNVIAGVACSMINKRDKAYGLRVSPPSIFFGTTTEVVSPNVQVHSITAQTAYGSIYLGIGFKKGTVLWM